MIEEHIRYKIVTPSQHLLQHDLSVISYTHDALPGVTNMQSAMNWLVAVLYPNDQPSVANPAALPAGGNTLLDYRVVDDDGDGKAAGYRWEQREGDVAAKWYKIYDLDFGMDSILSGYLAKTQDVYVYKHGYDDLDYQGNAIAGTLAGQSIYGGASASTNLTLFANAGDGVGADTGYVQFGDQVRPTSDSAISLGTTGERWLKVWTDEIQVDTLNIVGAIITDSSGQISFDNDNLLTTGTLGAGVATLATGSTIGNLTLADGSITSSSGAISFGNENLSTTGDVDCATCDVTTQVEIGATPHVIINDNSLTYAFTTFTFSSGTQFSFDNKNVVDVGTLTASTVNAGNLRVSSNTLIQLTDATMTIQGYNGKDIFLNPVGAKVQVVNGDFEIGTGQNFNLVSGNLDANDLRMSGGTLSVTSTDTNLNLQSNGIGDITLTAPSVRPSNNGNFDLGETSFRWKDIFLSGSLGDGSSTVGIAALLQFNSMGSPSTGDSLFWSGTKWVASNPDSEIIHGEIGTLDADDHEQYMLLAGRATGQSLIGGIAADENLTLESTSHATKGEIVFKDVLRPDGDNLKDIGDTSNYIKDLYMKGQLMNGRMQVWTTAGRPAASAGNQGRFGWNSDIEDIEVDRGGYWLKSSMDKWLYADTWNGSTATKTYTVNGTVSPERGRVSDSRDCIWVLKDNSNDYIEVEVDIDCPSSTQIKVTAGIDLPAGTYTLIGIG